MCAGTECMLHMCLGLHTATLYANCVNQFKHCVTYSICKLGYTGQGDIYQHGLQVTYRCSDFEDRTVIVHSDTLCAHNMGNERVRWLIFWRKTKYPFLQQTAITFLSLSLSIMDNYWYKFLNQSASKMENQIIRLQKLFFTWQCWTLKIQSRISPQDVIRPI